MAGKIVLLIALAVISGCGRSVLEQKTGVLNRDLPDEISSRVSVIAYKGDTLDYVLTADKIERFYNKRQLNAWKVKLVTYDVKQKIRSTMLADTTWVDEARNFIVARGNVVLNSPNGQIKTSIINWDRNIDQLNAPEQVELTRDGNILRGQNLRTDATISYAEMDAVSAEGVIKREDIDW